MRSKHWWGGFEFSEQEIKCWQIGERRIAIQRGAQEWTIWNQETPTEINDVVEVNELKNSDSLAGVHFERFLERKTNSKLFIEPSLADQAMIVRPSKPITVMPGEEAKLYVSTPIWMTISMNQNAEPMYDVPFWRPSDSWFGPNTISGDVCYAKYTDAKLLKEHLEVRSHRASTLVTVLNEQEEKLLIQRLNLPVPLLKVYVNKQKEFWTDQVSILQRIEHSKPTSTVSHSPPDDVHNMEQVSESREMSNKSSLMSSIKNLIG